MFSDPLNTYSKENNLDIRMSQEDFIKETGIDPRIGTEIVINKKRLIVYKHKSNGMFLTSPGEQKDTFLPYWAAALILK